MTDSLLEVRNAVLSYLLQQPLYNPKENLGLVEFPCENEELKAALIEIAMKELQALEMVVHVETSTGHYWILRKHLKMYEQNVSIGFGTAIALADTVNQYCKKIENQKEICEAGAIKERDIQKLILILENELQK